MKIWGKKEKKNELVQMVWAFVSMCGQNELYRKTNVKTFKLIKIAKMHAHKLYYRS